MSFLERLRQEKDVREHEEAERARLAKEGEGILSAFCYSSPQ